MEKLVRDKIPELMRSEGLSPSVRVAVPEERLRWLIEKLVEEVEEVIKTPVLEELADVAEVIDAISKEIGFDECKLSEAKTRKKNERGDFSKGFLLSVKRE